MRDLIRNYKDTIRGHSRTDSGSETDPLVSSYHSNTSCGISHDDYLFSDSDITDNEMKRPKVTPVASSSPLLPKGVNNPTPYSPTSYRTTSLDRRFKRDNGIGNYNMMSKLATALSLSQTSLLYKSLDYEDMESGKHRKTQSSLVTIFAIWNTTMGSSLLAMAWGMGKAGLFPGIIINLLIAAICLYTCYVLLKVNEDHGIMEQNNEVSDLCRLLVGQWAEVIAKVFSLVVLIGANIVYWVLMSNFLYNSVELLYDYIFSVEYAGESNDTVICPGIIPLNTSINDYSALILENTKSGFNRFWDLYSTVPIVLALIMFPLLNFRSPTFFTKFNSLGTLSVMYLLIFATMKSIMWGINVQNWQMDVFTLKSTFSALSGMLSLSYFIHNIIISVMRNNRNQDKNGRDLTIAFGLITFTYLFLGVSFYITFPLSKTCIQDNILNNFNRHDTMTIIVRLLLLFQLVTVFPLISFMLRNDILTNISLFFKNYSPGFSYIKVIILNLGIVTVCVLFACFLPKIGTLIRYTGALSGLVYIFFLPSLLKIASLRKDGKLTIIKLICQCCIIIFGVLNLVSQFFIID